MNAGKETLTDIGRERFTLPRFCPPTVAVNGAEVRCR